MMARITDEQRDKERDEQRSDAARVDRNAEFYASSTEDIIRLDEQLMQKFEQSLEGREANYLQGEVCGKFLADIQSLTSVFLNQYEQIARTIEGFNDSGLAKEVRGAVRKLHAVAPMNEIEYFRKILAQIQKGDVCAKEFQQCVVQLNDFEKYLETTYPKSYVLRKLRASKKLVHIKQYVAEVREWKEILYRMLFKEELGTVPQTVLNAQDIQAFEGAKILLGEETWTRPDKIDAQLHLLKKKCREIGERYGDPHYARILLQQFTSKGFDRAKSWKLVMEMIQKMQSPESLKQAEHDALIDLHGIVKAYLKHADDLFEYERASLVHTITKRILKIKHKHAADLEKVEFVRERRIQEMKSMLTAREVEDAGITVIKNDIEAYLKISSYILAVVNSNAAFWQRLHDLEEGSRRGEVNAQEYQKYRNDLMQHFQNTLAPALDKMVTMKKQQAALYNKLLADAQKIDAVHESHDQIIHVAAERAADERKEIDELRQKAA
ncbi:hypothetical protein HY772_03965 [Candidatus Woesearchaeota archaeon]|nr:hypothetical protein [Candidatus Woesearchaeota archaeon]